MAKKYKCRVEYLESTGTQWIDTGVIQAGVGLKAELTLARTGNSTSEQAFVGRTAGNGYELYINNNVLGLWNSSGKYIDGTALTQGVNYNVVGDIYSTGISLVVNGSTYSWTGTPSDGNLPTTATVTLFSHNGRYYATGKIYYCKLWDNGVLVRNFIPVLDNSGRPAMYDQVSEKLFYNKDSGDDFSYGRQIIPVEYLESTGTQGVDTGLKGTLNTSYEIIAKSTQTSSAVSVLLGSRSSASSNNISTLYAPDSSNVVNDFGNYNSTRQSYTPSSLSNKLKFYNSKNKRSVTNLDTGDYNEVTTTYSSAFTTPNNLHIGLKTSGYVDAMVNFSGYIYGCKIWDNDTLVRDFIPCIDENLTPFMFDLVTNTCYLNAGTGQFKVGPNVEKVWGSKKLRRKLALALANLKKKRRYYCEVEYLESTGTQYIDTGLKGKNNLDFDYKCIFTNLDGTAQCVGGNWSGAVTSTVSFYLGLIRTNGNFAYHYDGTQNPVVVMNTTVQGTPYIIKGHMWVGEQYMVINGTKSSVGTIASTFTSSLNMYLFGINNNGLSNPAYMKLYYCKIYDNGVLVRDMIPVLDWDMKPCMFDRVTEQLFYNAGTGDFTAGREIHPVEYLESTGTQYIDTDTTFQVTDEVYFKGALLTRSNDKFVLSAQPWNNNNNRYSPLGYYSNKLICAFGNIGTPGSYYSPTINDSDVHTITYKNKVFTMEDTGAIYDGSSATFGAETGKIKFFYGYNAPSVARIDAYKQWRDGELICDFIPAIDENGVGYMFDRVSHTIYDNAGTGAFDYPPVELDYIECVVSGTNKPYINTGVYATENTRILAKLYTTDTGNRNYFGGNANGSGILADGFVFNSMSITQLEYLFGKGSGWKRVDVTNIVGIPFELDFSKSGVIVDGSVIDVPIYTSFPSQTLTVTLFVRNGGSAFINGRVYYFKMYENGTLVRDFIPCYKDGVACMVDKLTGIAYLNQGTGSFAVGRIVEPEYE